MGKKLTLDVNQRFEAVTVLVRREEPAAKIAGRYGISEQTRYRLREQFLEGGRMGLARKAGLDDTNRREVEDLHKQPADRDQAIGELTIANRILKRKSGTACCERFAAKAGQDRV